MSANPLSSLSKCISAILFAAICACNNLGSNKGQISGEAGQATNKNIRDSCIGEACSEILYIWNQGNTFKNIGKHTISISLQGKQDQEKFSVPAGEMRYSLLSKFHYPFIADYIIEEPDLK